MSFNYIHLTKPYEEFVSEISGYIDRLSSLLSGDYKQQDEISLKLKSLNDLVLSFLNDSFNEPNNLYFRIYKSAKIPRYRNVSISLNDITNDINEKIRAIDYILNILSISDIVKNPSDNLYAKRQSMPIKQKKDFILWKLYDLDKNSSYDTEVIYIGNGLKKHQDDEPYTISKQLGDLGYVSFIAGSGTHFSAQITIKGIEYVEEMTKDGFGIYSFDNELSFSEKKSLETMLNELKEDMTKEIHDQFKDQQDFIITALDSLYQVVNESIELVNTKLPKQTIRQAILGKVVEKSSDHFMGEIMNNFWMKFKAHLVENKNILELTEKAKNLIENS